MIIIHSILYLYSNVRLYHTEFEWFIGNYTTSAEGTSVCIISDIYHDEEGGNWEIGQFAGISHESRKGAHVTAFAGGQFAGKWDLAC